MGYPQNSDPFIAPLHGGIVEGMLRFHYSGGISSCECPEFGFFSEEGGETRAKTLDNNPKQDLIKMTKPIAIQLFSVRKEVQSDLPGTLRELARMGYDGVEFFGTYPHSPEEIRGMLRENNLQAVGYHVLLPWLQGEELAKTIALCNGIGTSNAVVAVLPEERRKTKADWIEVAHELNGVREELAKAGITLGYHNHRMEFDPVEGALGQDLLFQTFASDVVMELDIGHALRGGADPIEVIKKYPNRQKLVHVREFDPNDDHALVGEGTVDWKSVLPVCASTGGAAWYIIEQGSAKIPAMDAAQRCLDNLKAVIEG